MITNSTWNTGLHLPGDYQVCELSLEVSRFQAVCIIQENALYHGQLAFHPPLSPGNQTNYTLQNSGNADVMGLGVKVAVVDLETQTVMSAREETIDLIVNDSQTGQMTFSTEGYGIKTYAVNLDVVNQGNQRNIAKTSFIVKDGTPPVVSILSPILERFYNSRIDISALAADYVSGIDKVEYQLDGGSWRVLLVSDPSQGRYSTPWDPVPSDEGVRTVSIRATDRAGNMSLPVSVQFTFDLTPPTPMSNHRRPILFFQQKLSKLRGRRNRVPQLRWFSAASLEPKPIQRQGNLLIPESSSSLAKTSSL
jgi:hypothetical protein